MEVSGKVSDEHLVIRFKNNGDNQAFSTLIARHKKTIYKKCFGYVQDEATAEDLCQEVLIRLYLQIKNFKNQAKFSTWLFSIIHNICIDHLRKDKKNLRNVLSEKLMNGIADMVEEEDEIPQELSIKILDDLLEQLTPQDKMLLLMKYKEKHHIKDIQQTLGISESAIKMRLKRAREKINKLYQKHS